MLANTKKEYLLMFGLALAASVLAMAVTVVAAWVSESHAAHVRATAHQYVSAQNDKLSLKTIQ